MLLFVGWIASSNVKKSFGFLRQVPSDHFQQFRKRFSWVFWLVLFLFKVPSSVLKGIFSGCRTPQELTLNLMNLLQLEWGYYWPFLIRCASLSARQQDDQVFLLLPEMCQKLRIQDFDINFCLQFWTENHVLNLHPKELIKWGSMAASQCHSWWRWSDTLWVTLARLWLHMFAVVRLEPTQQLPLKWFCGVFF